MARNAAALSFGAEVSTRSLFFTAWTAAALFGRGLHLSATDDDDDDEPPRRASTRALDLERFRRATKRLALTETQQVAIDQVVSQIQPLIVQLRVELKEKQQALVALHPGDNGFLNKTGRISNDIGTLATQLALTSNKLKKDIYGILSTGQQAVLGDLQTAFEQASKCSGAVSVKAGVVHDFFFLFSIECPSHKFVRIYLTGLLRLARSCPRKIECECLPV